MNKIQKREEELKKEIDYLRMNYNYYGESKYNKLNQLIEILNGIKFAEKEFEKMIDELVSYTCKCGCVTFDKKVCRSCGGKPAYGQIDYDELKQKLKGEK